MKNEKILALLNEGKLTELKQLLIEEIGREENKALSTYKALQRAAKYAHKSAKNRNAIDGARYIDGETIICDGYFLVDIYGTINGLQEVTNKTLNYPDYKRILNAHSSNLTPTTADINAIKNSFKIDKKEFVKIGTNYFNPELFIIAYECIENPTLFEGELCAPLMIKGDNGVAIVLPIRINTNL